MKKLLKKNTHCVIHDYSDFLCFYKGIVLNDSNTSISIKTYDGEKIDIKKHDNLEIEECQAFPKKINQKKIYELYEDQKYFHKYKSMKELIEDLKQIYQNNNYRNVNNFLKKFTIAEKTVLSIV